MLVMKFKEYATNKFMATNACCEVDIIAELGGFGLSYTVETANDSNVFETWDKAVRFAEHKYGVRNVFEVVETEEEYYDRLFAMDSDGYACLGGQI